MILQSIVGDVPRQINASFKEDKIRCQGLFRRELDPTELIETLWHFVFPKRTKEPLWSQITGCKFCLKFFSLCLSIPTILLTSWSREHVNGRRQLWQWNMKPYFLHWEWFTVLAKNLSLLWLAVKALWFQVGRTEILKYDSLGKGAGPCKYKMLHKSKYQ